MEKNEIEDRISKIVTLIERKKAESDKLMGEIITLCKEQLSLEELIKDNKENVSEDSSG